MDIGLIFVVTCERGVIIDFFFPVYFFLFLFFFKFYFIFKPQTLY